MPVGVDCALHHKSPFNSFCCLFTHCVQILHDDLHWLDVADRVMYKLGVIMHRCRHGKAHSTLSNCCTPVTDVVGRQCLRSATQQMMVVPRHRLSTIGHRAFAVQGPTVRNFLLDDLRAQQDYESFRQHPRTWLFSSYQHAQHIRDFVTIALHKFTFTITITTAPSCYFRSLVHLLLLCQFVPFSEHIGLNYITAVTRNSNEHAKYYLWF